MDNDDRHRCQQCMNASQDWLINKNEILASIKKQEILTEKANSLLVKVTTDIEVLKFKSGLWGYVGGLISLLSMLLMQFFLK